MTSLTFEGMFGWFGCFDGLALRHRLFRVFRDPMIRVFSFTVLLGFRFFELEAHETDDVS